MQRSMMGKKKNDQADTKWRHSAEAVEKGKVNYSCKLWGSTPVSKSKGSELIKEAIKKLQFANDIKKSEEGLKASKLKKVDLCISIQSLILTDLKTKNTLHSFPLQQVSYCADDKASKRLFGFIAREKESSQHHCYILECEKNAEELTLAVGQAFDLAYKKYKANQSDTGKEVNEMKQKVELTEKENEILRKRLEEMERNQKSITEPPLHASHAVVESEPSTFSPATFDPFSENSFPSFQASSFEIQSPPAFPTDPRPVPPGVGSNPFAVSQEAPANNHADLFHTFEKDPPASNLSVQQDDIFDPLSQMNGTQQDHGSVGKPSSNTGPGSEQSEILTTSLSRPKPGTVPTGLLPPPPTKQSIKEKNRSSLTGLDKQTKTPNDSQAVQEVQDGVQNNLVVF